MSTHGMTTHGKSAKDLPLRASPGWGKRLSGLRIALGLTQREVVAKTGLSIATVTRHEAGEGSPRESAVTAYERLYQCSRAYILHGLGPSGVPGSADATPDGPPHAELWQQYYDSSIGADTAPATRELLAGIPFSVLGIQVPTQAAAHELRLLVERHGPVTRHSPHGAKRGTRGI